MIGAGFKAKMSEDARECLGFCPPQRDPFGTVRAGTKLHI
jgi:hypothetical protein